MQAIISRLLSVRPSVCLSACLSVRVVHPRDDARAQVFGVARVGPQHRFADVAIVRQHHFHEVQQRDPLLYHSRETSV